MKKTSQNPRYFLIPGRLEILNYLQLDSLGGRELPAKMVVPFKHT